MAPLKLTSMLLVSTVPPPAFTVTPRFIEKYGAAPAMVCKVPPLKTSRLSAPPLPKPELEITCMVPALTIVLPL